MAPARSAHPEIERLRTLLAGPHVELHLVAFAQVLEIDFGREPGAMEKDLVTAVVRNDKPKPLVFHDLFDCAEHVEQTSGRSAPHPIEIRPAKPYVKSRRRAISFATGRIDVIKSVGLAEIERIFAITDAMGISREALVIPLRTASPGSVRKISGGRLEIVVERDAGFDEWLSGLETRIRQVWQAPA